MRRLNLPITVAIGIVLIGCCIVGFIVWEGYYLPNKPCQLISYPVGTRIRIEENDSHFYETEDSVETVIQFYDEQLNVIPLQGAAGTAQWVRDKWVRLEFKNENYIYECLARDITRLTQEQSCIYISKTEDSTVIEMVLYRSSEEFFPCSTRYLSLN